MALLYFVPIPIRGYFGQTNESLEWAEQRPESGRHGLVLNYPRLGIGGCRF